MAAQELAQAGCAVTVVEAKPSAGRKLLMAGKSGLNLTKAEELPELLNAYDEAEAWLTPIISDFDAKAVRNWAEELGQKTFTGTTGRVFPVAMKASPLLRAWLALLDGLGVSLRTRWRWTGWDGDNLAFDTPEGAQHLDADVTVLALGGASWSRLGSDGNWAAILAAKGIDLAAFQPANAGLMVNWSEYMKPAMGQPLKGVSFKAGSLVSRGEAVISTRGLEGGGIYSISKAVRQGADLNVDLLPDISVEDLTKRLSRPRGKSSWANHLRKTLKLGAARTALLQEFGRPLPQSPEVLAKLVKMLPITHAGLRPLDEAISTAGGVTQTAVDSGLMLKQLPGVFCAGEMLNWEAPTGGYLLTACLATGRTAGRAAAQWASK
jgi:uncharacterized flavoprotein (TIGR03862 family)